MTRKCTARKLASRDLARLHFDTRRPLGEVFSRPQQVSSWVPMIYRSLNAVLLLLRWIVLGNSQDSITRIRKTSPRLNLGHCQLYWRPTLSRGKPEG